MWLASVGQRVPQVSVEVIFAHTGDSNYFGDVLRCIFALLSQVGDSLQKESVEGFKLLEMSLSSKNSTPIVHFVTWSLFRLRKEMFHAYTM